MTSFRELAPAKVNLTLEVVGRRPDGFHELRSLVAFADVGDTLTLDVEQAPAVTVSGPFAGALVGTNILDRALSLIQATAPRLRVGAVRLGKHLPVAAGLGGGSADAGALLRAARRANEDAAADVDWTALAAALGADVPVCLAGRACWMTGAGHGLSEIAGGVPTLDAVIVNPMAAVPADKTAQVYRALGAAALANDTPVSAPPVFADREALVAFIGARGNHLAAAAAALVPEVGAVLGALASTPGVEHVAVSGAGPTAFGIYPDKAAADAARDRLVTGQPGWWIVATKLG